MRVNTSMNFKEISWDKLDKFEVIEDALITYLLYKEGKNIDLISRIRNISREKVEKDIIKAKIKIREMKSHKVKSNKTMLDKILGLSKEKRLELIKNADEDSINKLKEDIKGKYNKIKNPDDKVILIWLIGELKDKSLMNIIIKDMAHYHGNVRRMVCSALGKLNDPRGRYALHRGLNDKKAQVRQYAAKALADIGNEESIRLLKDIVRRQNEKDYVKIACINSIKIIKKNIINEN